MQRRWLVPVAAVALIGVTASCDDESISGIDENFEENATWTATLNAANERPTPVNSPATGRAWFIDNGNTITYRMEYSGLLAPANAAHIHRGTADVAGAVMVPLTIIAQTSGVTIGTIDMTVADVSNEAGVQSPADLRALLNSGGAYVNVHSNCGCTPQTGFPGGEIRGQTVAR